MKLILIGKGNAGKSAFRFLKNIKKSKILKFSRKLKKKNIEKRCFLIDLSNRKNLNTILKKSYEKKTKIILGTTGYNKKDINKIKTFSKKNPIFICANFNFFFWKFLNIIKYAKKVLPKKRTSILEKHNLNKKDCPSGSSKILTKILKPVSLNSVRYSNTIGIHEVFFYDKKNELLLKHKCKKRSNMFKTLPKFLLFLRKKKKGLFIYPN
ncbi:4-hydroxy-tetrahydrodipicolinate reductase [Candidatus Vidania fulgoroideae]|nr:4-hydroxy-tetrahydrodipicolinate reductase [Candidatus Vidania fulgoroideae]